MPLSPIQVIPGYSRAGSIDSCNHRIIRIERILSEHSLVARYKPGYNSRIMITVVNPLIDKYKPN